MKGHFISLEGGEGTGKSTQIAVLAERLRRQGRTVLCTREPGGTDLGRRLRELLVQTSADPPGPLAELLLYAADRAHHVETVLRPALRDGRVILCDRYADATEAYQGHGRGISLELVRTLNQLATDGLWPDRTLVLDLCPRSGVARSLAREGAVTGPQEARFEAEDQEFHQRVRDGYRCIARAHPRRVRVVDASGTRGEVAERLWGELRDLF